MTRNDFNIEKSQKDASPNDNHLTKDKKVEYFERLIKPYEKVDGVKEYFIMQYLQGDGNELKEKFWSIHSSSRFAFELYSWMVNDIRIKRFCFEKKLEGLKDTTTPPNMDVYFELDNRIIFIESKFSEISTQSINNLSEAYYVEKGQTKTNRGLAAKLELIDRYHNHEDGKTRFVKFINDVKEKLSKKYKPCWMDYKQEITHLVGIYLTIANDKTGYYKNKDIDFYNVYYDFEDKPDSPIEWFFDEAKEMMIDLLVDRGLCKSFEYKHLTAQNLVESEVIVKFDKDTPAFGLENKTIGEMLKDYFDLIIG